MVHECIYSHVDLQALQARTDEHMYVKLVSLESVHVARKSYALLRPLVLLRSWSCPMLDLLSLMACLALELHKIEHDLLPRLQVQEANLEVEGLQVQEANLEASGVLEALLLLKNAAMTLLRLGKGVKELSEPEEDEVISDRAEQLGVLLKHIPDQVLKGTYNITWFQGYVPHLLQQVKALSATPVRFV
ncbi:unnamed protein product [Urochloa decumbens]|uniref:Uncharacterized protein n=1 Tax=Urochloa decumbens TaxID=240449 RepID=A0ABC9G3C4_9POAL